METFHDVISGKEINCYWLISLPHGANLDALPQWRGAVV